MAPPIYMDCHATTRVDPRVVEAMLPFFTERYGNAASRSHGFGWDAEEAVDRAREQVAALIGARDPAQEIVFTSGATESDNLAIKGAARFLRERDGKDHVVTCVTEHKAVIDSCRRLEREGFRVTWLPVDAAGQVRPDDVAAALDDRTALVSIMRANNEVGTVQPLEAIGRLTRERGVWLHCDAVQGVGRTELDVDAMHIDLLSLTAHKFHGPKGVGALYVRRTGPTRVRLLAEMDGGGHERGMRSGTLNVPGIVGLGEAAAILAREQDAECDRLRALRDRLRTKIEAAVEEVHLNGAEDPWRHPGNLNLSFGFVEGQGLILALQKHVAVSSGAACSSASTEPSYVLRAMGVAEELAEASIRFGLGRFNTEAEVDQVARVVAREVARLRDRSDLWQLHRQGVDVDW
ncbi:MAG: IscS subfamily cysteine desulfurase [Myxococcota bacterium]